MLTSADALSSTIHRAYYRSYKKIYLEEKKQGMTVRKWPR